MGRQPNGSVWLFAASEALSGGRWRGASHEEGKSAETDAGRWDGV